MQAAVEDVVVGFGAGDGVFGFSGDGIHNSCAAVSSVFPSAKRFLTRPLQLARRFAIARDVRVRIVRVAEMR